MDERDDGRAGLVARLSALPEVRPKASWGETAFFVNPAGRLKNGTYFATIKDHDGDNDRASGLSRPGLWRLSLGPGPAAFEARFGPRPARPPKGGIIAGDWDFTARDRVTPHPVYGWMGWFAVNCPSAATMDDLWPLVEAAHDRALGAARKRLS